MHTPWFFKRNGIRIALIAAAAIVPIFAALSFSVRIAEPYAHISPDYPRIDIRPVISKKILDEDDYKLLFYQTGLGKPAIDDLRKAPADFARTVLCFQDNLFRDIGFVCEKNSPISWEESVVDANGRYAAGTEMAPLHNGYILVTKSSHTYGWRNGHAALVVDAARGETLESVVLGTSSSIQHIDKWTNYPNFMVFRLRDASAELTDKIARSAADYLYDIPYDLSVGILSPKSKKPGNIGGTHCSHLVWQAFRFFGYDLDSDGGAIVTPMDIAGSPLLEIVQVYGVNPAHCILSADHRKHTDPRK